MLCGYGRATEIGQLHLLRTLRKWTGMMNQQLLDEISRQAQKGRILVLPAAACGAKGFDFDEFEIELVHHRGGLERMARPLDAHAGRGNPPEFGVKQLDEPARSFMVAAAKARHQLSYGVGPEGGHIGTQFRLTQKNQQGMIQTAGLLSHYGMKGESHGTARHQSQREILGTGKKRTHLAPRS